MRATWPAVGSTRQGFAPTSIGGGWAAARSASATAAVAGERRRAELGERTKRAFGVATSTP